VTYLVNDIFYTLQGEGHHAGRPAVFCRFSRCNLWSGREEDRASAVCRFCDTDFLAVNHRFGTAAELAGAVSALLPAGAGSIRTPMVVLTGGEPTLQIDRELIGALLAVPMYVSVETNGTRPIGFHADWVCVSPKAGAGLAVKAADEVKLVYPQTGLDPESVRESVAAGSYRLQPMDGPDLEANTAAAVEYCLAHPHWSLSVQTHKVIGVK
jgi:7-carboxy-7-deazaguanine synthase (Cx14CxxC type)